MKSNSILALRDRSASELYDRLYLIFAGLTWSFVLSPNYLQLTSSSKYLMGLLRLAISLAACRQPLLVFAFDFHAKRKGQVES